MRTRQTHAPDACPPYIDHPRADELREIDRILEETPELVDLVFLDLVRGEIDPEQGRDGMSARQVLGAALAYHLVASSFDHLAFLLKDSISCRRFCRIPEPEQAPASSTLCDNISLISAMTWQAIDDVLLEKARSDDIESGETIRTDCTVCESNIHAPTDVSLCCDVVRVGCRLLEEAADVVDIDWTDHTLRARRRALEVRNTSGQARQDPCQDLLKVTEWTLEYARAALDRLDASSEWAVQAETSSLGRLIDALTRLLRRGDKIVDQTRRRLLEGEKVPADEKLVSIFEPHTDIIVTSQGEVEFGHKVMLTTGPSSMVLDVLVLEGNPADSQLTELSIERHVTTYGESPRCAAYDGGFASQDNLDALQNDYDLDEVAFHKTRGLEPDEMTTSRRTYRRLRAFRAGAEGLISWLKHTFGLKRCRWTRGLEGFRAYVHGAVVSANLLTMARERLERRPG